MSNRYNIESSKVEGLIPRQLISDSAALIEFLKEYYRFLNQENNPSYVINNLLNNRDLDTAVDEFITLIHNEIGSGFVKNLIGDKQNLYKHIQEFYRAKGSLDSFQLLFKLLFDTNVEITLPKDKILVASGGKWNQQTSIFISATVGDPLSLYGKIITISSSSDSLEVEVERIQRVTEGEDYYEIFITKNTEIYRIITGATINQYGVVASVINSLNTIEVIYAGQNFEVPQYVNIEYQSTGTKFRISELIGNGVDKLKIISYGIGYTNNFYARIVPRVEVIGGVDLVVIDEANLVTEQGNEPTHAILKFSNGPVALYTGEYSTTDGFLSDDIYLQDNYYYQQYSYVIKSGIQIDNYRNIVRKTVNPAGMIFFGKFEITNLFDVSENINSLIRYVRIRLESPPVDTSEYISVLFQKNIDGDSVDTENADIQYSDFYKQVPSTDSKSTPSDSNAKLFNKFSEDLASVEDQDIHYTDFYKNVPSTDSITSPLDSDEKLFNKGLETTADPVEDNTLVDFFKGLETTTDPIEDNQAILFWKAFSISTGGFSESRFFTFDKNLNDLITPDSFINVQMDTLYESLVNVENYDVFSAGFDKNILNDSITTEELISFILSLALDLSDSVDLASNINNTVFKELLETITTSDISSIDIEKVTNDSINTNESGFAELNPYSFGYFAEEYTEGTSPII